MILRPLFLLLTIATVVLALVTTTGRVVVALLPRFEAQINAMLVPLTVELAGLKGEWRGLNPVIYADSVRFSGGRARGFRIEVDLLETAANNALVATRFHIDELSLAFVRGTDAAWRLGEQPAGTAQFDFRTFVLESDAIVLPAVDVAFFFERDDGPSELVGQFAMAATFANGASRHKADVRMTGAEAGELRVGYDIDEKWFGILPEGRARLQSTAFSMPHQLGVALGGVGFDLLRVDADWEIVEGTGGGHLSVAAEGLTLPTGNLEGFDVELVGSADFGHQNWHFSGRQVSVRGLDAEWDLSGLTGMLDDEGVWTFGLPRVDVATAAAVTRSALTDVDVVNRWLRELNPVGQLDAVALRWSSAGLLYSGRLIDGAINDYRGAPEVTGANLEVRGSERSVTAEIVGGPARLHFVGLLDEPSVLDNASGVLTFGWKRGLFGIRGDNLAIRQGAAQARGGFLLSRPAQRSEDRLVIMAEVWDMDAPLARKYLTTKLPASLFDWLDSAIVSGHVDHARIAYHGHVKAVPELPMRQIELALRVRDGVVRFDPAWPLAEALAGDVFVTSEATIGRMTSGQILDITMNEGSVYVPNDAEYVAFAGLGTTDGTAVLGLIRETPLRDWLSFVHPQWTAVGGLSFRTDFKVPISGGDDLLDVELDVDLHDLTVGLSDVELELGELMGSAKYRYPYDVSASNVHGVLFGRPARFGADTLGQELALLVSGRASVAEILDWLALPNPEVAAGEFDFDATYRIWPEIERPSVVDVASDLVGVDVGLPAPFGKPAEKAWQARADTILREDRLGFSAEVDGIAAVRLELVDGEIAEGSLGIGMTPPEPLSGTLVVSGSIDELDVGEVIDAFPADDEELVSINWLIDDLRIARALYRDIPFVDLVINGESNNDGVSLSVVSPDLTGTLADPPDEVPRVEVAHLRLPPTDEEDLGDPLAGIDVSLVPEVDVRLSEVMLGEDNFGSWTFDLRNRQGELVLEDLEADLKGLQIVAHEPVVWSRGEGVTIFDGTLSAGDLAEVLPLWGYAASVESTSATIDAQVTWLGSPLNFWIRDIVGQLDLEVREGRFLDVETGAGPMRVVSLMNFNAIAKRMTLDFSDVFGKGIAFDEIDAKMAVDRGVINFIEPMVIDGTGSNFKVSGSIDLNNGDLDNEMIVTLPVNKSLPWYAAYLGIVASPLAAAGVLVGERILREQIEQFSSARYTVAGTLESPTVTFVGVFNAKQTGQPKTPSNAGDESSESASEAKDA